MIKFRDVKHPNVFEVNTRLLLRSLSDSERRASLTDIPESFWTDIASRGMNYVWLMGVWSLKEFTINPEGIPDDMFQQFRELLPDYTESDVDGSPYAIEDYVVDPVIGGESQLLAVRDLLHSLGMGLILDFVPNHFGAHTHWLHTHPEYFIEVGESAWRIDQRTFYVPKTSHNKYFGHGKDPYFEAWQDTIQVDYAFDDTREFMTQNLIKISQLCDGVRCDMAMLPVKRIFEKTWGNYVQWNGEEFWPGAINAVKGYNPDFKFIAECYWDMEAELLEMGFDYAYDKTFYDRLVDAESLKAHFNADMWYLERTVRFLENHDEERAAAHLPLQKHMAAAALLSFSPGMRLWHLGQWEGRRTRIPVQLTRAPKETCGCLMWNQQDNINCKCVANFYRILLPLANRPLTASGDWAVISYPEMQPNLFCWRWILENESWYVAINFSDKETFMDLDKLCAVETCSLATVFPPGMPYEGHVPMMAYDVRIWKVIGN